MCSTYARDGQSLASCFQNSTDTPSERERHCPCWGTLGADQGSNALKCDRCFAPTDPENDFATSLRAKWLRVSIGVLFFLGARAWRAASGRDFGAISHKTSSFEALAIAAAAHTQTRQSLSRRLRMLILQNPCSQLRMPLFGKGFSTLAPIGTRWVT